MAAAAASADYSDWLSELDKYASTAGGGGNGPAGLGGGLNASSSGTAHKGRLSAVEQLEQEMKLLHWHKLANEAALKAALIRTKRLRQKDKQVMSRSKAAEKAAWMQRVVEEEQMKPLEVTDDFIRQYEAQERAESEKLESEVERHIKNLQSLKQNLVEREELTKRHAVFRKKKHLLEKTPVLVDGPDAQSPGQNTLQVDVGDVKAGETVAASLTKLVELEKRIAQLETNDRPPSGRRRTPGSRMSARSGTSTVMSGTSLVFHKKRTATRLDAPAKTVYSVQMVNGRRRGASREQTPGSKRLQARARARAQRAARERARNERQGAIINNWMTERKAKQQARRSRIAQQRATSKARAAAARRDYGRSMRSGRTGGAGASRSRGPRGANRARGPAAGARQQFHDVRKQFEAAKDKARLGVAGARSGYQPRAARGTRTRGGKWATKRTGGARARPTGTSFRFSTRRGGAATQQVGSRLRGRQTGTRAPARRPRGAARTTRARVTNTRRRPARTRRSGAAAAAAARAAARRRAAAAAASNRHKSRARGGNSRSTGFGTSNRFKSRSRRPARTQPRFGGAVSGRGVSGRRGQSNRQRNSRYGGAGGGARRRRVAGGGGARRQPRRRGQRGGTVLPVIGQHV